MDIVLLTAAASATAFATGLGAVPVFFLGSRAERPAPGPPRHGDRRDDRRVRARPAEAGAGGRRNAGNRARLRGRRSPGRRCATPTPDGTRRPRRQVPRSRRATLRSRLRRAPRAQPSRKGFAIGTAYASDQAGLSLFVILAIGLQNVPEGTSVAIPMAAAGFSRAQQFWAAVLTSAPQPVGAVLAFLLVEHVRGPLAGFLRVRGRRDARARGARPRSAGVRSHPSGCVRQQEASPVPR